MMAVRLTVPVACWRKGHAREYLETHPLPPPATCYGALLSLVGEEDRQRHVGCRVTGGVRVLKRPSRVLRTLWRVKDKKHPLGTNVNAKPDYQEVLTDMEVVILLDSREEQHAPTLEERVREAFRSPGDRQRFGGWALGESTHLVNDAWLDDTASSLPAPHHVFLEDAAGDHTLPVWVDHVGSAGTHYVTGKLVTVTDLPGWQRIPSITHG